MVFGVDQISLERHKQYPVGMGSFKFPCNTLDLPQFEPMTTSSFLAGATTKEEFREGVVLLPLRAEASS